MRAPAALREAIRRRLPVSPPEAGDGVDPATRNRREVPADPRAELLTAALLVASGALGLAFVLLYAFDDNNRLLGLSLGLSLLCLSAALILIGKRVVPQEQAVEERPELVHPETEREAVELLAQAGEGVSRRKLITGAAAVTGLGLGGALVAPVASCGPNVGNQINETPWRSGRGVVDEHGAPLLADDITVGTFVTGFPQAADRRELGAPIVIVRLAPDRIHLPPSRPVEQWAPEGIVAYSKICTHAACAIALYRYPLFQSGRPRPALVCPCHYSTFDPARAAEVIFGPAGRPLPQLPLAIDSTRQLVANGGYSGSIGPAWFSVKRGRT